MEGVSLDAQEELLHIDSFPYWSTQIYTTVSDLLPHHNHQPDAVSGATDNIDSALPDPIHGSPSAADSVSDSVELLDRENQVNFVIDMFQQRMELSHLMETDEFVSELFHESNSFDDIEHGCSRVFIDGLESELGLESGLDLEENDADCGGDFLVSDSGDSDNLAGETRFLSGLRVVGIETDSEDDEPDLLGIDMRSEDDDYADENVNDEVSSMPLYWDSFHLEEDQGDADKEFEWEEVEGGIDEREVFIMMVDPEEEESVSDLHISGPAEERGIEGDRGFTNLGWEVLLTVGHLDRNAEMDSDFGPHFGDRDDYIYGAEHELMFGQLGVGEIGLVGRPPASKFVIDNLPPVVMTEEHTLNNATCAVCKDEMVVGVIVKQLPCSHRYHGECILPWLEIRNTCPVCRYELPTDDAEYERRRSQTATRDL
ncbi:hypothetical protein Dimus_005107 [Dionaea muscipula]